MSSTVLDNPESVRVDRVSQTVQSDPAQGIVITGKRSPRVGRVFALSWQAARWPDVAEALAHRDEYGVTEFDWEYQGSTLRVSHAGPISFQKQGARYAMGVRLIEEG